MIGHALVWLALTYSPLVRNWQIVDARANAKSDYVPAWALKTNKPATTGLVLYDALAAADYGITKYSLAKYPGVYERNAVMSPLLKHEPLGALAALGLNGLVGYGVKQSFLGCRTRACHALGYTVLGIGLFAEGFAVGNNVRVLTRARRGGR